MNNLYSAAQHVRVDKSYRHSTDTDVFNGHIVRILVNGSVTALIMYDLYAGFGVIDHPLLKPLGVFLQSKGKQL